LIDLLDAYVDFDGSHNLNILGSIKLVDKIKAFSEIVAAFASALMINGYCCVFCLTPSRRLLADAS